MDFRVSWEISVHGHHRLNLSVIPHSVAMKRASFMKQNDSHNSFFTMAPGMSAEWAT